MGHDFVRAASSCCVSKVNSAEKTARKLSNAVREGAGELLPSLSSTLPERSFVRGRKKA